MSFFGKPVEFDIELINEPPEKRYSVINPVINGILHLNFKENVKKLTKIALTLDCKIYVNYTSTQKINPENDTIEKVTGRRILEEYVLFEISKDINIQDRKRFKDNSYSFSAGEKVGYNFQIEFPDDKPLPSTADGVGDSDDGEIIVNYCLRFSMEKQGLLNRSKMRIYAKHKIDVSYQSGVNFTDPNDIRILEYNKTLVINDKIKKFNYDPIKKALIPTSLEYAHSKTKGIRKFWNDNYKPENFSQYTKTIPLTVTLSIPTILDLKYSFANQIKFTLASDLHSYGIESNDTVDFILNGQSTKLGYFEVESLRITSDYTFRIISKKKNIISFMESRTLCDIKFNDLNFDVCYFEPDQNARGKFTQELSTSTLCQHSDIDIDRPLIAFCESTIACHDDRELALNVASSTLTLALKISDGNGKSYIYEFTTFATPGFLVDPNSLARGFSAPPPRYAASDPVLPPFAVDAKN